TVLYLRNLESGEEWPIYDQLSKDQQEAWSIFGLYTGYSWTPDDKQIIIWSNGKIWKLDVAAANKATQIPFTCAVKQKIYDAVRFQQDFNQATFKPQVIRHATTSPDGKWLVFNAVGYLWKKELPSGTPERLVGSNDAGYRDAGFEFEPSFSRDGKWIVYTTWNDTLGGSIYKIPMATGARVTAKPVKINKAKGIFRTPVFSPDGKWIAFVKESGSGVLGSGYTAKPGTYIMNADGANEKFVTDDGGNPMFNLAGDRLFIQTGSGLRSVRLDGEDVRVLVKSTYGSQFTVSPDEKWIAFIDLHKGYVASFPEVGKTLELGAGTADFPVKVISKDAGYNLHWSNDSKQIHYTLGSQYYSINLNERFEFIANKPDSLFKIPEKGIDVNLTAT
ncbi:MAG: amidohydrolase, partial [Pedobacter sp.]